MNILGFLTGGMPGIGELLIILVVLFVLFGAKKLPSVARSVGKSMSAFKQGRIEGKKILKEMEEELENKEEKKS